MAEIVKDIMKLVAEIVVLLMVVYVLFSDQGILTSTFNYFSYAEPIILQDYLTVALTVGSYTPGEFLITIKTSGEPHEIQIRDKTISVKPAQESFLKTQYVGITPNPILTNCTLNDQEIKLPELLVEEIDIKKFENEYCGLGVDV